MIFPELSLEPELTTFVLPSTVSLTSKVNTSSSVSSRPSRCFRPSNVTLPVALYTFSKVALLAVPSWPTLLYSVEAVSLPASSVTVTVTIHMLSS